MAHLHSHVILIFTNPRFVVIINSISCVALNLYIIKVGAMIETEIDEGKVPHSMPGCKYHHRKLYVLFHHEEENS